MVEASRSLKDPAGGGGGGREESKPASFGKSTAGIFRCAAGSCAGSEAGDYRRIPSLPVAATVVADPMLVPPDARDAALRRSTSRRALIHRLAQVPEMVSALGQGGGIGPGEGGGLGPGRGGNIGGGDFRAGGGGPGGGGGGDYSRIFTGREVTSKARLISKPEPQYTEDARKNQVTGTVVLKCVFSSNGTVTNIRTVSGLPHGLTERAIAAARQIKFVPATKDGHQVSMWMQLDTTSISTKRKSIHRLRGTCVICGCFCVYAYFSAKRLILFTPSWICSIDVA